MKKANIELLYDVAKDMLEEDESYTKEDFFKVIIAFEMCLKRIEVMNQNLVELEVMT